MIIGSHLLEAVVLEDFEAVDVQDTDDGGSVVVVLAMAPLLLEKNLISATANQTLDWILLPMATAAF